MTPPVHSGELLREAAERVIDWADHTQPWNPSGEFAALRLALGRREPLDGEPVGPRYYSFRGASVHSGEPETPQPDIFAAARDYYAAARTMSEPSAEYSRWEHNCSVLLGQVLGAMAETPDYQRGFAAGREAAAFAPGAGLDVDRLARALCATNESHYRGWDSSLGDHAHMGMSDPTHRENAEDLAAAYERLGATPDPRPETDPS